MLETSAIVFWDRERTGRGSLYLWSLCTSFFHYLLHFLFLSFSYMYFVPCCSPPASVLSSVHPSAILISNATEQISTKFGKVGFSTECWRTSFFYTWKPTIAYGPPDLNIERSTFYPHVVCLCVPLWFLQAAIYFSVRHSGTALSNANAPCSYVIYELNVYMCRISFTVFR